MRYGDIVRVKKFKELLDVKEIKIARNGNIKIGKDFEIPMNLFLTYEDTLIVVRNLERDLVRLRRDSVHKYMVEEIEYKELMIGVINYVFNYYIEKGYKRGERMRGKVIMYDSDNFEEIRDKIIESIKSDDFSNFSDKEIMAMAKAVDFVSREMKYIDMENCLVSLDTVYYYLQFNMDYKIVSGEITSERIP